MEVEKLRSNSLFPMFLTISRLNLKAGSEAAAKAIIEKNLKPGDGKKPSEVVPGLVGFGLMRAKKDPDVYGVATVWENEAAFDALASNPDAKSGGSFVAKLQELCSDKIQGEGFYIEGIS
jgi:heme-degrading monooxygenase HmoA